MYIPKSNILADQKEAIEFMKQFSFATMIISKNNTPVATHLPFLVDMQNDKIVLTSHLARANRQWKDIETETVLVIFSEPHAYISPKNYEHEKNVPTWNYISVHAYGKGKLINDFEKVIGILEQTIDNYEESYREQWITLPQNYKDNLVKGLVAFQVEVVDLQAKKKLSQNKSEVEQRNIIDSLSKSDDSSEKFIADYMMKELRLKGGKSL